MRFPSGDHAGVQALNGRVSPTGAATACSPNPNAVLILVIVLPGIFSAPAKDDRTAVRRDAGHAGSFTWARSVRLATRAARHIDPHRDPGPKDVQHRQAFAIRIPGGIEKAHWRAPLMATGIVHSFPSPSAIHTPARTIGRPCRCKGYFSSLAPVGAASGKPARTERRTAPLRRPAPRRA